MPIGPKESEIIELIAKTLGVQLYGPSIEHRLGLYPPPPTLGQRLADGLWDTPAAESSSNRNASQSLSGFAHLHDIDVSDEFWPLLAIARAVTTHPYFAPSGAKPARGRPKKSPAEKESQAWEKMIQIHRLQTILELSLGRSVSDQEVAEEMAKRDLGGAPDPTSEKQADELIATTENCLRELKASRRETMRIFAKYGSKRPSMRNNSRISADGQPGATLFNWAPSETELRAFPNWNRHFRQLRQGLKEKAALRSGQ